MQHVYVCWRARVFEGTDPTCQLCLTTSGRTYYLVFENPGEAQKWKESLLRCVRKSVRSSVRGSIAGIDWSAPNPEAKAFPEDTPMDLGEVTRAKARLMLPYISGECAHCSSQI